LYTVVAHKFLSCIVIRFIQSADIDISQFTVSWNTQAQVAMLLPSNKVVQDKSGLTLSFLKQRIESQRTLGHREILIELLSNDKYQSVLSWRLLHDK
jgi:hypothetical protein